MAKSKNSKTPDSIQPTDLTSDSGNGHPEEKNPGVKETDGREVVDLGADPLDGAPEDGEWDLDDHRLYLNRELTWLNFNRRVLRESEDQTNPLFERLKFMAIVSSNLDEFFMKRIGGLKQLIGAHFEELSVDGRTPSQQIKACYDAVDRFENEKTDVFHELVQELKNHDIFLLHYEELNNEEKEEARQYFIKNIYPLVTPQGIDPAHPFPFISNLSMNLLVTIKHPRHDELAMARVKVPVGQDLPRFIQLGDSYRYVYLEEVMRENLDILFPDVEIKSCKFFRVTRNANTEREEEKAEDLLELIESELRERKFAPIVRAQVRKGLDAIHKRFLSRELNLDESQDLFETESMLGKHDLFELTDLNFPDLKVKPHHPIDHPRLQDTKTIF
ncbi:MAG: RNA degradosome polyphosphate kinase, partial [Candidatus Marinimicrobia bacterium]|nr:RNA degradosome polyphosphate kinase [Candidatus Neomarinimicrobiota bacterium]